MTVNRRSFLKGMAAVSVVAAVGLSEAEQKYEWKEYSLEFKVQDAEYSDHPVFLGATENLCPGDLMVLKGGAYRKACGYHLKEEGAVLGTWDGAGVRIS